ncbi:hypothetical protein OUZ56_010403 [Daphnia magna]|uniref:Uncharacterized protein n=1 Tax=Daphnia magna TaxID=35525 RepID=A0ABR0AIH6_9CRUS|nr:hypothetical protein OUZ56_010403 [Daphnia magna]
MKKDCYTAFCTDCNALTVVRLRKQKRIHCLGFGNQLEFCTKFEDDWSFREETIAADRPRNCTLLETRSAKEHIKIRWTKANNKKERFIAVLSSMPNRPGNIFALLQKRNV